MLRTALILLAAAVTGAAPLTSTPLTWVKTNRNAEVSLKLPGVVSHVPVLADRLYRGEIKGLEKFAAEANDPKDGRAKDGPAFRKLGPWEMQVTYQPDMETPRLISLFRDGYTDTHGAHPNHSSGGVVFDKPTNRNLHPLDLLKPGADVAALDRALCAAARAAKRERQGLTWNEKEDTNFSCPTWRGIAGPDGKLFEGSAPPQIALAPGNVTGRAGGLMFLYSPYDIGAYAEGDYAVVVSAKVLAPALKPDYAAEFAGEPKPIKSQE